jgi:ABC-type multidrug transport system ATPase subunit
VYGTDWWSLKIEKNAKITKIEPAIETINQGDMADIEGKVQIINHSYRKNYPKMGKNWLWLIWMMFANFHFYSKMWVKQNLVVF